jgi:hypothetical protein
MSYKSDIQGPRFSDETPNGGGDIENLEIGLGGPWSVGYSRIGVRGDIPGSQSDVHVNYQLPGAWIVQVGASMGELSQFPEGPRRNDFNGTTYSLLKAFRLSRQWRFQASYTNVPVRAYEVAVDRPVK